MYSQDFCYWLQGYFEISGAKEINEDQIEIIKNHLNLVFKHEIDPKHEGNPQVLQNIHDGKPESVPGLPGGKPSGWGPGGGDPLIRC